VPVLNQFLKVKGTFETSTSATIKSPPTILLHFQLHLIQHIAHFTIVEQLMAEYYHAGDCRLLVMDMPFNVGHNEALDKWNLDAAECMHEVSLYNHVVVFVTTHSDPNSGDLWLGLDKNNKACAAKVDNVSTDVTRGLRVLREQLFLRLLLTTRRASEYTLDFRELPRYVEAKLT
jgi:hypothetical protein